MVYDKKAEKAARKAQDEQQRTERAEAERLTAQEARFWASPYGQARNAKIAGHKYFQIEMAIDSTYQSGYSKAVADIKATTRQHGGQGEVLTFIEKEGWDLVHAGFVFKESGQVSRDKFLSSGQQVTTTGSTYGIYLFRATDAPPRSDEPWREWGREG